MQLAPTRDAVILKKIAASQKDLPIFRGPRKAQKALWGKERQSVKRSRDFEKNRGKPKGLAATWRAGEDSNSRPSDP